MAGVKIVIIGQIKDNETGETENVTITGLAGLADYYPGHPLPEPPEKPPVVEPPGIWGPPGPWVTPPIAFPPGWIGGVPPGGWPEPPDGGKPPEVLFDWKIGWTPDTGWIVVAIPNFNVPAPSK